jgi:hypothetical protein
MTEPRYWFPAKRYGWGWGLPITWQGWIVFLGFLGLVMAGAILIRPRTDLAGFLIYIAVLSLLFACICWWKGEPARWRWGSEDPTRQ